MLLPPARAAKKCASEEKGATMERVEGQKEIYEWGR